MKSGGGAKAAYIMKSGGGESSIYYEIWGGGRGPPAPLVPPPMQGLWASRLVTEKR